MIKFDASLNAKKVKNKKNFQKIEKKLLTNTTSCDKINELMLRNNNEP